MEFYYGVETKILNNLDKFCISKAQKEQLYSELQKTSVKKDGSILVLCSHPSRVSNSSEGHFVTFHATHLQGHRRSSALGCLEASWALSVAQHEQQGSASQSRLRVVSPEGSTCCWKDSVQVRSECLVSALECICLRGLSMDDIFLDTGLRRVASFPWAASWKVWVISSPWSVTQTWRPSPLPQRDPPSKQNRPSTTPYRLEQMKMSIFQLWSNKLLYPGCNWYLIDGNESRIALQDALTYQLLMSSWVGECLY